MILNRTKNAVLADLQRGRDQRAAQAAQRPVEQPAEALTLEQRAAELVAHGWRIESQLPGQIVLVVGKRPNHVLHLLLSVLTLGLWLIPWAIVGLTGGERRQVLTAGPDGHMVVRKG